MKNKKNLLLSLFGIFALLLFFSSCKKDDNNNQTPTPTYPSTVTDIDGNVYHTIKIGNQVWLKENLKVTKYRNGDPIENVTSDAEWSTKNTGAYCNYENEASNGNTYGKLYNWYALNDSRNIAPAGWHVPSESEWKTMIDYLGGESQAGGKLKENSLNYWSTPNYLATNSSGFTALPGGGRNQDGIFNSKGLNGIFWTSSEYDNTFAWLRILSYDKADINKNEYYKKWGASVRLIKD
mgnify:CR=1 FL=1